MWNLRSPKQLLLLPLQQLKNLSPRSCQLLWVTRRGILICNLIWRKLMSLERTSLLALVVTSYTSLLFRGNTSNSHRHNPTTRNLVFTSNSQLFVLFALLFELWPSWAISVFPLILLLPLWAQSGALPLPTMPMAAWPGGLPPMGYGLAHLLCFSWFSLGLLLYSPLSGKMTLLFSADTWHLYKVWFPWMGVLFPLQLYKYFISWTNTSFHPLLLLLSFSWSEEKTSFSQPQPYIFNQPRPKRCATHCYIARSISVHQQIARMNSFWPAAATAGSGPLYGAKPCNLNVVPSSADMHSNIPGGRGVNPVQDKGQGLAMFPGHNGKDKASQAAAGVVDSAHRKQILLQQPLPPGAPSNILVSTLLFSTK